jgi:hypothetical protein
MVLNGTINVGYSVDRMQFSRILSFLRTKKQAIEIGMFFKVHLEFALLNLVIGFNEIRY